MYNSPLFNDSNLKLSHQLHCVKFNNISNIKGHLTFEDNVCEKKRNVFNVFVIYLFIRSQKKLNVCLVEIS